MCSRNSWWACLLRIPDAGLLLVLLAGGAPVAQGQNVTPDLEYQRYLAAAQRIEAESTFGEEISPRSGALSFRQVDLELIGTGPAIRIARTFGVGGRTHRLTDTSGNRMGEWELVIPRLKTLASAKDFAVSSSSPRGWQVGAASNARCTQMSSPGPVIPLKDLPIETSTWWGGYQLVTDRGEEEAVLGRINQSPMGAPAHVARTKSNWLVSCLPGTSNGEPGEAFLGTAPDGTRYWFDYLVYQDAPSVGAPGPGALPRKYASMLVSRIEDRFGNSLQYTYSGGLLTSISASDGRSVSLQNDGVNVTSVSAISDSGSRTWSYGYANGVLTRVGLPDGSAWTFALGDLPDSQIASLTTSSGNCSGRAPVGGLSGVAKSGRITSPSGASALYTVMPLHSGRSNVPKSCWSYFGGGALYADVPKDSWSFAITSKVVSGPGLPSRSWLFQYSEGNSSWDEDCTGGCPGTVWADQISPDGSRRRLIFSNRYGGDENLTLREEYFAAGTGALLRSVDYAYAISPPVESASPYPWRSVGLDRTPRSNKLISERWTPLLSTTIRQDGEVFRRLVNQYDILARPVSVTRSSGVAP